MKKLMPSKVVLMAATPLIASFAIAIPSARAATFALSEAEVSFTNFNISSVGDIATSTNTNASPNVVNGNVTTEAQANAVFLATPPQAANQSFSTITGDGLGYDGFAFSQAKIIGNFFVFGNNNSNQFSFNFTTNLNLEAAVDQPSTESAIAKGNIAFVLFGGQSPNQLTPIDFFVLTGKVDTSSNNEFLNLRNSKSITLLGKSLNTDFGSTQESALALVQGLYSRNFKLPTYLTLVETTTNEVTASAAVPEPSTMAAIAISGIAGCILKRRTKAS